MDCGLQHSTQRHACSISPLPSSLSKIWPHLSSGHPPMQSILRVCFFTPQTITVWPRVVSRNAHIDMASSETYGLRRVIYASGSR